MQYYKTKAKKNDKFEEYEQFLDGYKDVLKLVQKLVISYTNYYFNVNSI